MSEGGFGSESVSPRDHTFEKVIPRESPAESVIPRDFTETNPPKDGPPQQKYDPTLQFI